MRLSLEAGFSARSGGRTTIRFERLDLNLLVALDALIEERSVSLAARRLCLSQPAVSGALNRLREFFDDELLVPIGRQMVPTPKAEELREPVRDALMLIRSRITTPAEFDPSTVKRHFTIVASDWVYSILLSRLFVETSVTAPHVRFDVVGPSQRTREMMDRGEADVLISIEGYLSSDRPQQALFTAEHCVIAWSQGRYGTGLTLDDFLHAGHASVLFGADRFPALTEMLYAERGLNRTIDVRVPSFSSLPQAVIGTDRVATMYRRHAEYFAELLPLSLHVPPVDLPPLTEMVQWHKSRSGDPGLMWLIGKLSDLAQQITA